LLPRKSRPGLKSDEQIADFIGMGVSRYFKNSDLNRIEAISKFC
jgi:hypothetical protein